MHKSCSHFYRHALKIRENAVPSKQKIFRLVFPCPSPSQATPLPPPTPHPRTTIALLANSATVLFPNNWFFLWVIIFLNINLFIFKLMLLPIHSDSKQLFREIKTRSQTKPPSLLARIFLPYFSKPFCWCKNLKKYIVLFLSNKYLKHAWTLQHFLGNNHKLYYIYYDIYG